MSFFGTEIEQSANGAFDSNPAAQVIPAKTMLTAIIDEAEWDEYEGDRFIKLRWCCVDGEYKNRKVFQKVRVCDTEAKKKDKALRMLAAIDANAGGKLIELGKEPTDMDLIGSLSNKPMVIELDVWNLNGNSGNWVKRVAPAGTVTEPDGTSSGFDEKIGF